MQTRALHLLRLHLPIVLLVLWVALTCCVRLPWQAPLSEETEPTFHTVLLLSSPSVHARSFAYEAVVLDSTSAWTYEDIVLYLAKDTTHAVYQAGDVLLVHAALAEGRGFAGWGKSALIEHRETKDISWMQGKGRLLAMRIRDRIEQRLDERPFSPENRALVESILLGDRRRLSIDQREAFSDAGAMHVLAVSGLHVGIIRDLLLLLLSLGGWVVIPWKQQWAKRLRSLIIIILIWTYALLTGFSISVVRSALMFSLLPLNNTHKESSLKYSRLATAALIILLCNPTAIRSASFLLSFSAVLAIMYYIPRWNRHFSHRQPKNKWVKIAWKTGRYVGQLLAVSIAAQIGTLTFTLLFFGQTSNYFFLTNLLILPLTEWLFAPLGLLTIALCFIPQLGFLANGAAVLTNLAATAINASVSWVQHLPGATSYFAFTPLMAVFLAAFILATTASFRGNTLQKYTCWAIATASAIALLITYNQVLNG